MGWASCWYWVDAMQPVREEGLGMGEAWENEKVNLDLFWITAKMSSNNLDLHNRWKMKDRRRRCRWKKLVKDAKRRVHTLLTGGRNLHSRMKNGRGRSKPKNVYEVPNQVGIHNFLICQNAWLWKSIFILKSCDFKTEGGERERTVIVGYWSSCWRCWQRSVLTEDVCRMMQAKKGTYEDQHRQTLLTTTQWRGPKLSLLSCYI